MKSIKDILAELTGLKARVDAAGQAEVARLEGVINGVVTQLQTDVTTARASVTTLEKEKLDLSGQVQSLTEKLSDANKLELDSKASLLKHLASLPGHEDYKDGGAKANATLAELIAAEQNATNAAMAATGVKVETIPAGGKAPEAANKPKNLTEACMAAKNKKA